MKKFSLNIFGAIFAFALCAAAPQVQAQTVTAGQVLISEFRLEGPANAFDEYIEFYCNRDTACDISGFNIVAFDPSFGDFSISFPANTIIEPRGYLLVGDDAGYSLEDYATLDLFASFGGAADFFIDNEGIQLQNADSTVVIDSVGFIGGGGTVTYIEGTGLQRATAARPDDQYAYVRNFRRADGRPQDTNNNAADFALVSVTGAAQPGITAPPILGAPGPQNVNAPLERNATFATMLVEPANSASAAPNRVRVGSGNSGTISIRRSFTNNTGAPVTFLVFRATDITTLNSPQTSGGQAQLRLVTSGDAETFTNSQGRVVVIRGTVLEFDDTLEPTQPNGGGLNSSVNVNLGGALAPGATIDVQFLLNVVQAGSFRFFVNIEAATGLPPLVQSSPRRAASSDTPREMSPRRPFAPKAKGKTLRGGRS